MNTIQSTGSYDPMSDEFSMSFAPNNNHLITFEGLSIEDMREIQSLVEILLEHYKEVHK
jgi:hypothetical protein